MGMKSLKWEGIGTKNLFPHTSNVCVCVCMRACVHACVCTLYNLNYQQQQFGMTKICSI